MQWLDVNTNMKEMHACVVDILTMRTCEAAGFKWFHGYRWLPERASKERCEEGVCFELDGVGTRLDIPIST